MKDMLQALHFLSSSGNPLLNAALQMRIISAEQRSRVNPLDLLEAPTCPCHSLLPYVQLHVHEDLLFLFCKAAFPLNTLQHICMCRVVPLQMQDLPLSLLKLMKFQPGYFSSLLASRQMSEKMTVQV